MDSGSDRLKRAFALSEEHGDHGLLLRLLRRHRREGFDERSFAEALSRRHPHLEARYLHPRLLPPELLVAPQNWRPEVSGIHTNAVLAAHPQLRSIDHLLSSGLLNRIIKGEAQLYDDLPAIALDAYAAELRQPHRSRCKREQLSALSHLAGDGREAFRRSEPVAACLDRYRWCPEQEEHNIAHRRPRHEPHLVVVDADQVKATRLGRRGGWNQTSTVALQQPQTLIETLQTWHPDTPVSLCHRSDQLTSHALDKLSLSWHSQPDLALCSSDEVLAWNPNDPEAIGNPQHRVRITPSRVICRGAIGGLVTIRAGNLKTIEWQSAYGSMHELLLDLSLQVLSQGGRCGHCSDVLLIRQQALNPSILDVASPLERQVFNLDQIQGINTIAAKRSEAFLSQGGSIEPHPHLTGCQRLRFEPKESPKVSIIIPFRDQLELTRACLQSIRRHAGAVNHEIILVNNGSTETSTINWLNGLQHEGDIKRLDLDIDFNFALINNEARKICKGDFLLFLNNDIEFRTANTLQTLLDPFALNSIGAVGSRLFYPDGEIQHQGVILVSGERRALLEPGKNIQCQGVLDRLTPLRVEESFSAASAACLMVKSKVFDAVGGFNEQFAVTFNDVDLCLRIRKIGYDTLVTPFPTILHHEGKTRGKDLAGEAFSRQQQEQGYLRKDHADLYANGDPLTSTKLQAHSKVYEARPTIREQPIPVRELIQYSWKRLDNHQQTNNKSLQRPLLFFAHFDTRARLRSDILPLLKAYQKHADLVFISASSGLRDDSKNLEKLQERCEFVIIRGNEGYDFGSWMTGLRFCDEAIKNRDEIIITNDSLWGPITPLDTLFNRIHASKADAIGLTDDLMYSHHLQSSFMVFRKPVTTSRTFADFWSQQQVWSKKRDLVKACEVGLSTALIKDGFNIQSLYSNQSNGNILHFKWRQLIEDQDFPFLKVSLLRDNPTEQDISEWIQVIKPRNSPLCDQIKEQLAEQ